MNKNRLNHFRGQVFISYTLPVRFGCMLKQPTQLVVISAQVFERPFGVQSLKAFFSRKTCLLERKVKIVVRSKKKIREPRYTWWTKIILHAKRNLLFYSLSVFLQLLPLYHCFNSLCPLFSYLSNKHSIMFSTKYVSLCQICIKKSPFFVENENHEFDHQDYYLNFELESFFKLISIIISILNSALNNLKKNVTVYIS